jgi:N-acetylmuramate 1-kinase
VLASAPMARAVAEPRIGKALEAWLGARGGRPETLRPLAGDVSPRRYFRCRTHAGGTAVLATYPPQLRRSCRRFLLSGRLLAQAGVAVPAVEAHACSRGWMLLEDLGTRTLFDLRDRGWARLAPLLLEAAELARRIAGLPAAMVATLNPPLDEALLARELEQTWEVFLRPRGLVGDDPTSRELRQRVTALCRDLGALPPVPCHRDFMARNLVPRRSAGGRGAAELVVLDHQDLRLGPPGYDLASLLNDSLFPPPEVEEAVLARALLPGEASRAAYHRAAVQRTLKAVGTFAAFAARGSHRHLPLIPPTLTRALDHLARLPDGAPLADELRHRWRDVLVA